MNLITDTWRQLVRRRLWPVALLLVAAAAALPFLLRKAPEVEPAAVPPANAVAATTDTADAKPVVALVDDKQAPAKRRRVLGARKDPFEPAALPKVKKVKKAAEKPAVTAQATATPAPSGASGGASAPSSGSGTVSPVAAPAPKKTYPHGSLQVRFGKTDDEMKKSTLERLKTLPSASNPLLVFMGLKHGGKIATFMVTGDVTAEGDGHCDPDPQACETLELRAGETEFITVKGSGTTADVEYELDVLAIH